MGTPHEPKWGNGGPMSHLGSPRSETRYHLLCSIIFGAQCSQVTGWEWTLTRKTVVAIGPPTGHELRYGTRSDIHLQRVLLSRWFSELPVWWDMYPFPGKLTHHTQQSLAIHRVTTAGPSHRCYQRNHRPQRHAESESGNTLVSTTTVKDLQKDVLRSPNKTNHVGCLFVFAVTSAIIYPSICLTLTNETICLTPWQASLQHRRSPNIDSISQHQRVTYDQLTGWWFSCKERNGSDNFTHTFATNL